MDGDNGTIECTTKANYELLCDVETMLDLGCPPFIGNNTWAIQFCTRATNFILNCFKE